jgi:hypothetical protein
MTQNEPILVKGTRVLGPYESDTLRAGIPKNYLQTIYDVCLWSGMRYIEVRRFWEHPEWWQPGRKAIHLPEEAQKKMKRKQLERYIHPVPPQLENVLGYFHSNPRPPSQQAWNENLQRWARNASLDPQGISSKTTRKSIESWMISAGTPLHVVCLRQGHDSLTSMNHYQGLPFTDGEGVEISRRLAGWT